MANEMTDTNNDALNAQLSELKRDLQRINHQVVVRRRGGRPYRHLVDRASYVRVQIQQLEHALWQLEVLSRSAAETNNEEITCHSNV